MGVTFLNPCPKSMATFSRIFQSWFWPFSRTQFVQSLNYFIGHLNIVFDWVPFEYSSFLPFTLGPLLSSLRSHMSCPFLLEASPNPHASFPSGSDALIPQALPYQSSYPIFFISAWAPLGRNHVTMPCPQKCPVTICAEKGALISKGDGLK